MCEIIDARNNTHCSTSNSARRNVNKVAMRNRPLESPSKHDAHTMQVHAVRFHIFVQL